MLNLRGIPTQFELEIIRNRSKEFLSFRVNCCRCNLESLVVPQDCGLLLKLPEKDFGYAQFLNTIFLSLYLRQTLLKLFFQHAANGVVQNRFGYYVSFIMKNPQPRDKKIKVEVQIFHKIDGVVFSSFNFYIIVTTNWSTSNC